MLKLDTFRVLLEECDVGNECLLFVVDGESSGGI